MPPRLRRAAKRLALAAFALFATLELVARLLTATTVTGMPRLLTVPLLPFRPDAELVRRRLDVVRGSTYVVPDAELGWTIAPNGDAGRYLSNDQAIRTEPTRHFSDRPAAGRRRVVAVGDSFTHCDEVRLPDTWPAELETLAPQLEVLNFGVPGYGTDQALLRWRRDARRFHGDVAILGIWPEDICRNVNRVRYFFNPAGEFGFKPRFIVRDGALALLDLRDADASAQLRALTDPAASPLVADDEWFTPRCAAFPWYFHARSVRAAVSAWELLDRKHRRDAMQEDAAAPAFQLTVAIAQRFAAEVAADGGRALLLILPVRERLQRNAAPLPLAAALRAVGLTVVDLEPRFADAVRTEGFAALFAPQDHLTAAGNHHVAAALADELAR